jgi:hypothetical protein
VWVSATGLALSRPRNLETVSPRRLGDRWGGNTHAMEVRGERLLFLAGTVSLDSTGTPGGTLDEHLDLVWSNIRTTHIPRRRSA